MSKQNATRKELVFTAISVALIAISIIASSCLNPKNSWTRGGVGVNLAEGETGVTVKEVISNYENEKAQLQPGDIIVSIDEKTTAGVPPQGVLEALTGPVGSRVTVTVRRASGLYTFEIERIMHKIAKKTAVKSRLVKAEEIEAGDIPDKTKQKADEPE